MQSKLEGLTYILSLSLSLSLHIFGKSGEREKPEKKIQTGQPRSSRRWPEGGRRVAGGWPEGGRRERKGNAAISGFATTIAG